MAAMPAPTPDNASLISVCIVEDDRDLRQLMVMALTDFGFQARGCACARDFYRDWVRQPCNIVLLDINLPDEDGFSIMEHLRAHSEAGIIMLTARSGLDDRVRALTGGADVYLAKPVQLEELAANIVSLSRRLNAKKETSDRPSGWQLSEDGWFLLPPSGQRVALTTSERTVMQLLMDEAGRTVTREALAAALGHEEPEYPLSNRLDMLLSRLRRKVVDETRQRLPLKAVRGVGFSFLR